MDYSDPLPTSSRLAAIPGTARGRLPIAIAAICSLVVGVACLVWPESVVILDSTPTGAEVTVDGAPVGQTPIRLASRPWPVRGEIELRLAGYQPWFSTVESSAGETRAIKPDLSPMPASISLTSTPSGASVVLDGRPAGQTPLTVSDLPPGRLQLSIYLEQYQPWHSVVELEAGDSVTRDVSLIHLPASTSARNATDIVGQELGSLEARAQNGGAANLSTLAEPSPGLPAIDRSEPIYPVAIMVENAADSRPQSGLESADIVFEAMAEGGISRFMAVYADGEAPVVGPVRSARHYFVNLAAELGASLVFIGASPLGYESVQQLGLRRIDETHSHPGFWRTRSRVAPHNAYTSVSGARQALNARAAAHEGSWGGFTFKDSELRYDGPASQRAVVVYQPWGYQVEYRYDSASNRYDRFMEHQPHRGAETGVQIQASSVAVLTVNAWVIDPEGRLDMEQLGSGPAVYFVDGVAVEGTWSKSSPTEITRFLDRKGHPVRFNPGPVWVQLVSRESKVTY